MPVSRLLPAAPSAETRSAFGRLPRCRRLRRDWRRQLQWKSRQALSHPRPGRQAKFEPQPAPALRLLRKVRPRARPNRSATTYESCRSEEHTSELQSLMRISYAVFCLKKTKKSKNKNYNNKTNTNEERHKTTQA